MTEPQLEPKPSVSLITRRMIRSYGVIILIAIAFLLMAIFIREKPKVVPAQGIVKIHQEVALWL